MKIGIGSDHAGFEYKEKIRQYLSGLGHEVRDFGAHSNEPVDYPKFIRPVAEAVAAGECQRGIVLGGSGNGEAIVANRVRGIRCALCWNIESARLGREHNDANVISLGQRMMPPDLALQIVKAWLDTPFLGGTATRCASPKLTRPDGFWQGHRALARRGLGEGGCNLPARVQRAERITPDAQSTPHFAPLIRGAPSPPQK